MNENIPNFDIGRVPDINAAREGATILFNQWMAEQADPQHPDLILKILAVSDAKTFLDANEDIVAHVSAMNLVHNAPVNLTQKSHLDGCSTIKMVKFMVGGDGYGCKGRYIIINGRSEANCKESVAKMRRDSRPVIEK
jgi:hypothetical protein